MKKIIIAVPKDCKYLQIEIPEELLHLLNATVLEDLPSNTKTDVFLFKTNPNPHESK